MAGDVTDVPWLVSLHITYTPSVWLWICIILWCGRGHEYSSHGCV